MPNIHLEYGKAFHLGMEHILKHKKDIDWDDQPAIDLLIIEAYEIFLVAFRVHFDAGQDEANKPKNPARTLDAFTKYMNLLRDRTFTILYTEVYGVAPLSDDYVIHFKIDAIARDENGMYFSYDHKTTTRDGKQFRNQFDLGTQAGAYMHALYCLYPHEQVYGHIVNGAILRNEPMMKKDGTPRKGTKDTIFIDIPVQKTDELMAGWQANTVYWLDMMKYHYEQLAKASVDDTVMQAFPCNPSSCTDYGMCPHHTYCSACVNPLRLAERPPVGYRQRFWDPSAQEEDASYTLKNNKLEEKINED